MTNNRKTFRAGVILASLCLGTLGSQTLQASSLGYAAFDDDGLPPKRGLGKLESTGYDAGADTKAMALGGTNTGLDAQAGKPDWAQDPAGGLAQGEKWENSRGHADDDKWKEHPNGIPGPIDNPCVAKYCEMEPPAPVPVPAAAWLFGAGLAGLFGLLRRRYSTGTVRCRAHSRSVSICSAMTTDSGRV